MTLAMKMLNGWCPRRLALAARANILLLALLACGSRAETITGWGISSLPYTITNSGHYHLIQNFNHFSLSNGAAITIILKDATNDVVLDLNDRTITAIHTNQYGYGIVGSTTGSGRITVCNGTLRGFRGGVFLTCQGALIENITVIGRNSIYDYSRSGIMVSGSNGMVRNNRVINGGGTCIRLLPGSGMRVINNEVEGAIYGIGLQNSGRSFLENNRVSNCSVIGIAVFTSQYVSVVNSRITGTTGTGIYFDDATCRYRDNLTVGVTTPYSGGTDAGNNQ
jgi:parallel beta-helix repeat protein